ncbi:hypothetical protein CBS101457_001713 [Exobasidium rhododendri]|nr:hypothetical protein CBS101457_001713 [Exobasidium rhododendri]
MSARAVIIKGPKPDSRSYITAVPDDLETLIQKASDLFPVPPSHTPHFTLADDASVIVLPDFLPLIREREVLIFQWTPDTPRSSLRRSTGQSLPVQTDVGSFDDVSVGDSVDDAGEEYIFISNNKLARGVRWDDSVVSNEEKNKRNAPRARSHKDGKDSALSRRAEYVKQKIQEQEEIRLREAELHQGSKRMDGHAGGSLNEQADETNKDRDALTNLSITNEELLVSGSSPPSYTTSMPQTSTTQSEEEQQTSSPLSSPTRDIKGARKTDHGKMWMMGLYVEKEQEREPAQDGEKEIAVEDLIDDAVAVLEAEKNKEAKEDNTASLDTTVIPMSGAEKDAEAGDSEKTTMEVDNDHVREEEEAVEQAVSPQRPQELHNIRDMPAYQTMKSVVNQLRSHPSNHCFRQPCEDELRRFCQERARPVVDFFTISHAITLGLYGREDPLVHFSRDLSQMWNNVRTFYGAQSQQIQCANTLESFSGILLEEFNRKSKGSRSNTSSSSSSCSVLSMKSRANAPRLLSTPISRMEKRNSKPSQDSTNSSTSSITSKTQQQIYFASLMAKTGLAASAFSPSRLTNKKQTGQTATSHKRLATTSPQTERPAKKTQASSDSLPNLTVTTDDSTGAERSASITTRGTAKRAAAAATRAA